MDNMNTEHGSERDERRALRRQRRIRSQIIAYVITAVLLAVFIMGAGLAINKIGVTIKAHSAAKKASVEEQEVEQEAAAVSSPEENITDDSVSSEESMLDSVVDTCISEMPLEDKVAGLFMISPEQLTLQEAVVKAGNATQEALSTYSVGGIVYLSKNIKDEEQIKDMLSTVTSMSKYPLFIATSEVGGEGNQIAGALSLEIPTSPSQLGAARDQEAAYDTASRVADYLNSYGFNLNLGINANLSDSDASFGTDAAVVSDMVSGTVRGLQTFGVSACLQYFPETGNSGADADGMTEMLKPFSAGIEAGAKMIMVCTAPSSGLTGDDTPSCLSSAVMQELLRGKLGYDGVIVTDTLSDLAGRYSSADAAITAINAGADMIYEPENFREAYDGLLQAVQNGSISEDRINESLKRIYRVKYADRVNSIAEGK